jgi:addiction module HigA family antidote
MIPKNRPPTHPGEILLEEFLKPFGISQQKLADSLHVSYQRVNEVVRGKRGVTPSTALRLSRCVGMSPEFWMGLQTAWDIYHTEKREASVLKKIEKHCTEKKR